MKIDTFNTDLMVSVLAHIEDAREVGAGAHNQIQWGALTAETATQMRPWTGYINDDDEEESSGFVGFGGGCGTSQCVAGWTLIEIGAPMLYLPNAEFRALLEDESDCSCDECGTRYVEGMDYSAVGCFRPDEETLKSISFTAGMALGFPERVDTSDTACADPRHVLSVLTQDFTYCECGDKFTWWDFKARMPKLFHPHNSLEDVYRIAAAHAGITVDELRAMVVARQAEFAVPAEEKAEVPA